MDWEMLNNMSALDNIAREKEREYRIWYFVKIKCYGVIYFNLLRVSE